MLKKIAVTFIFILHLPLVAYANTVTIEDTGVTFIPPKGFEKLPKSIMDIKWPNNRAPRYAVGNKTASTTIAYDVKPNKVPQNKLKFFQTTFTGLFPRMIPGLKWIQNKIIKKEGRNWIYLEMTSTAIDTDIHNIMLVTGYKGKMLIFNFNSTKKDFPKYEAELRKSIASIRFPK